MNIISYTSLYDAIRGLRKVLEEGVMGKRLLSEFLRKGMQLLMQELIEGGESLHEFTQKS